MEATDQARRLLSQAPHPFTDAGVSQKPERPWRRAALGGGGAFAAGKVGVAAVSAFAWIGDQGTSRSAREVAWLWGTRYDSTWFTAIAEHGYQRTEDASPAAFFPLYPLLIRLVTPLCAGRSWLAGLVVANIALFAALVVLFRLAEHELGRAAAGRTVFYLVAFPTGFFLTAAYNEGLFLALMAAAVYAMRRRCWWWAGTFGGLAATARSAGILLLLAFAFEYARAHGLLRPRGWLRSQSYFRTRAYVRARSLINRPVYRGAHLDRKTLPDWPVNTVRRPEKARRGASALAALLIPAGLGVVMLVDWLAYRDPLAFSHTQTAHWGRRFAWPWHAPIAAAEHPGPPFTEIWAHNLLELSTATALGVLLVLGPRLLRPDQLVFPLLGGALLIFMVSFPSRYTDDIPYPLYSASRIGLEVFPAFMVLGRIGARPWIDRMLLAGFLTTQGILAAHFLHGGWVA